MTIFLAPSFKFFYLTCVHKIATNNTDSKLHDLNAITIGKLVFVTAHVQVIVDTNTNAPQINVFFQGMATRLVWQRL